MNLQQIVFGRLYRHTPKVEALPWHREDPPELLQRAMQDRGRSGRALDVGCGEGVNAVHLAKHGYQVVATDFVGAALDAARARARQANVELELRRCNVTDHRDPAPYDIVLDSGCLHHLPKRKAELYRARLDEWLAPGGSFVLVHFLHPPAIRWIPQGPRHLTREQAARRFAPLTLRGYDETSYDVPFPMGRMRAGIYWFTRRTSGPTSATRPLR